jgi:hypothetical protein
MHDLETLRSRLRVVDGTSAGTCVLWQHPVGSQNKPLDCREVVSRGKAEHTASSSGSLPINSVTVRSSTPAITKQLANVCRKQYQVKALMPVSRTAESTQCLAECDELRALYAFRAGRDGVKGVGLF